jgi:TonB family protein
MRKDFLLTPSLIASTLIHLAALMLATALFGHRSYVSERQPVAISLVDLPQEKKPNHPLTEDKRTRGRKIDRTPLMEATVKETPVQVKREAANALSPASLPLTGKGEASQPGEIKLSPPGGTGRIEGERSEADVPGLLAGENVAVVPGAGTASGGGGTAVSALGRASGAPSLSVQTAPLKTNRRAKPLQAARASYPAMALRMGLESDVMLKIEVDSDGKVTKAEIIKSGGAGFDEEALKAVKQSRFEPAQRDGQYVAAEFSYIYRFRLQR